MLNPSQPADISARNTTRTADKTAAALAMLMGAAMIFMIGFSHIDMVHNAAHDTRHSAAFPCH